MNKVFLLILMFVSTQGKTYCQQDITLSNVVPPSPEASAFAKYGTYPIGTYTGRPDISIPIYEIKAGTLSMPISLSYDATGIRVNDMATWVGMNWSLNAGGLISQMVVGQPDINTSTELVAVPPRASDIVDNTTYLDYFQSLVDRDMSAPKDPDADPDKFFYSFNGRSGSFVLDRSRNILQIPKTSLKISWIGARIAIIDENGVTYVFADLETTETYTYGYEGSTPAPSSSGSLYKQLTSAYYLSEIISPAGEHIYFTYESGLTVTRDDMYSQSYGFYWASSDNLTTNAHRYRWSGVQRNVTTPRLRTITFPNGKVELSRVADRQDDAALTSASRLDEITVYQKDQKNGTTFTKLRSFKLVQGYYYSPDTYGQYSGIGNQTVDRYRLRLDELKLRDTAGQDVSSYKFIYNSMQLPPKTSCSQDWWGYYNGKYNTTLVPTTTIPTAGGGSTTVGDADRSPDETHMKAGILEKIIYPTGGYTSFETETHKLLEEFSNVNQSYSGTGLGQISDKHEVVTTFTTPSAVISGSGWLNITISPYSYADQMPFVKIKNIATGQEQTFTAPGGGAGNSTWYSTGVTYEFSSNTTYELTGSCFVNQSNATANITASFTATIYDPHTVPVGGLRIKSIKNYKSDNTLAYEENYRYGENETGAGVFVGILGNAYNYSRSQKLCRAGGDVLCTEFYYDASKEIFNGGALFDQAFVQGSPVVYTDVVKYFGSPTNNNGKTVYNYGTAEQQSVQTKPLPAGQYLANNQGILIINDTWKKGQLIYQKDYRRNDDSTYSLVQESQNAYNIVYTDTAYGLIAQTTFDRINFCTMCARHLSDYNYAEYPVYSGYVQLAQNVKNLYAQDGNGYVSTVTNYTYDPGHPDFTTKTISINSKGDSLEATKKYPFNKTALQVTGTLTGAESTAIDSMITRNMISPVMEEINKTAGVQTTRRRLQYEFVNGSIIAPVSLKFQTYANPIETRLQFTRYDGIGNVLEQSKAGDVKHAYIWDYENAYPTAEVTNADTGSIAYTSFESNGTGHWVLGSSNRDTVNGITGNCSYLLNSSISKTGLSSSGSYWVSYWTLNNAPFSITGTISGYPTKGKTINGWTLYVHKITGQTSFTINGSGHIDELRLYPANAQMKSFTYAPLVGMTSACDAGNRITYYEYDGIQRLKRIRDQDMNIIKTFDYQYQAASGCGNNCYITTMQTLSGTNTIGYPVGVFNVHGKLLDTASTPSRFVTLWNADTANARIGTLTVGGDPLHFNMTLNAGMTLPAGVTGCRYYKVDMASNKFDGVRNPNAAYVDFGDGTGMRLPGNATDVAPTLPANTTVSIITSGEYATNIPYYIHTYPNPTLKTVTFYHNDSAGTCHLDNATSPAASMLALVNLRGNLPQNLAIFGSSCYQDGTVNTVAAISNWSSIHTVQYFNLVNGDQLHPNKNMSYAQDFMQYNPGLKKIATALSYYRTGYRDTTFKISRLKSDWNTYFTELEFLQINEDHWSHEDLSGLKHLNFFKIEATTQNHQDDSNSPLIPLATSEIDNILSQIAAGAGQSVTNGTIILDAGGGTKSPSSDTAVQLLLSKGWTIIINGVTQTNP